MEGGGETASLPDAPPRRQKLLAMRNEPWQGDAAEKVGPVAQWQSRPLITAWLGVRVPPGPPILRLPLCRSRPKGTLPVGGWRSLVAHLFWEQGVAGSNPVSPTISPAAIISRTGGWQGAWTEPDGDLLRNHIDDPVERIEIVPVTIFEKPVRLAHMDPAVEEMEEPVLAVAHDKAGHT